MYTKILPLTEHSLGQYCKANLPCSAVVNHSYLCPMLYFLLLMNVLLEQMVLASWKLKNEKKYKEFCFVLQVSNRQTNPPTDTARGTDQLTNPLTNRQRQTNRDRKNELNVCQIWRRVDSNICQEINKFTKLKLLHYSATDTNQLVWVVMVEIEAPAVSHECEVGFP